MLAALHSIDVWLGKRVFQPVVILCCWVLRCSQHRFANYLNWVAMLYLFWAAGRHLNTWIDYFFLMVDGLMAGAFTLITAVRPEGRDPPLAWGWRLLVAGLFAADCVRWLLQVGEHRYIPFWIMILLCAYARTIDTLPPAPRLTPSRRAKLAVR